MMKIAIVGGIGSGKSEALRVAAEMGLKTLSADEINSELLADSAYISALGERFKGVVTDGKVDRARLASIVFGDKSKLEELNALAHPAILDRIDKVVADILVVEMPLLIESGAEGMFDEIIFVRSPKLLRLYRLKKRRGMTYKAARDRMRYQASYEELARIATVIIKNGGSLLKLRESAKAAFEALIAKTHKS